MITTTKTTKDVEYANYLIKNQKSLRGLLFQWPYRAHLQGLRLGKTLDIGCGAGRNLKALNEGSVVIDHNELLVKACVSYGLKAFTTEAFLKNALTFRQQFSSILISHVAEHMSSSEFVGMLMTYKQFLQPGGRVVIICPQEKGYASDSTHVHFMDFQALTQSLSSAGLTVSSKYSYPFPRWCGSFFPYNEFVVIGRV